MDQKYVISFIFLIIVIGLVISQLAITGENPFKSALEKQEVQDGQLANLNPRTCQELCGNDNLCLNECYTSISNTASLTQDLTKCDEIQNSELRISCINNIKTNQALASNDVIACDSLEGNEKIYCKDSIYISQAVSSKDQSLCNQVQNPISKETCLNSAK